MSSSIHCVIYLRLLAVYFVQKSFAQDIFYFEINFTMTWLLYNIFIIVFGIKQLNKLWKKTFWTIYQLSCFVEHPECRQINLPFSCLLMRYIRTTGDTRSQSTTSEILLYPSILFSAFCNIFSSDQKVKNYYLKNRLENNVITTVSLT